MVNSENYCKKRDLTGCKYGSKLRLQYLGKYPCQYPIFVTLIKTVTTALGNTFFSLIKKRSGSFKILKL